MPDAKAIREHCTNVLPGHGRRRSVAETLREIADNLVGDEQFDLYGKGEYLATFEAEVAELFGKESAVFMPSGTMAQQIALRLWCEQSRNFTVAMHSSSHLEFAEQLGYQFLHGIHRLQFGIPELNHERLLTPGDFTSLAETPGAVMLELPCRPLGGSLPPWEDLYAIHTWAREKRIPMHMDGARLWQCLPFYNEGSDTTVTYADIAALFDSLYVSFYKDLGGLCGCMLIGPESFIGSARVWQRRHGGNLFTQSPFVESARLAMHRVLPVIDDWVLRAREIARVLAGSDRIRVQPDPPHVNFFRVFIEGEASRLNERHLSMAEKTGTWLFGELSPAAVPGFATGEIHCWENAMTFDLDALPGFIQGLLE